MENLIENLKNNFLFQTSLGSKELFHSNLIAWLLEQENENGEFEALKIFLEKINVKVPQNPLKKENEIQISREENNIDLIIKWKENEKWNYVFIENKMKSIPNENQLIDYDSKIKKYRKNELYVTHKFLLTPFDNPTGKDIEWVNITYSNHILDFLSSVINFSFKNSDIQQIVKKYIELLEKQSQLLLYFNLNKNDEFKSRRYDFYTSLEMKEIRALRLHDLILKLAHQKIGDLIKNKLEQDSSNKFEVFENYSNPNFKQGNIFITNGFTRSTGFTEIKICLAKNQIIGLQLQGNTLRYLTEVFSGKKKEQNKRFAFNLIEHEIWFYDCNGKLLEGQGRNNVLAIKDTSQNFNSYGLNFIYLYKDVSEYSRKSINLLVEFIADEIKKVIIDIEKFNNLIP
jgi:hypothetical protein